MTVMNCASSEARMFGRAMSSADPWIAASSAPTVVTESATHS
jgi:hypothetical protein